MSYQNLKAETKRLGITQESIASFLGMSGNNFNLKINGKVPFTIPEAKSIKVNFFPKLTIDYLFADTDGAEAGE